MIPKGSQRQISSSSQRSSGIPLKSITFETEYVSFGSQGLGISKSKDVGIVD